MAFDEYPEPPTRGVDSEGNMQDISVDEEGRVEVTGPTVEGLLYSIDSKLDILIELLKGLI